MGGGDLLLDELSDYKFLQEDTGVYDWLSSWSDTLIQIEGRGSNDTGNGGSGGDNSINNNNNNSILVRVLANSKECWSIKTSLIHK